MAQQFGKTWWGEQFLKALSKIDYSNRLPRGKAYARKGTVKDIRINKNIIEAKVKGSRPRPYDVKITILAFYPSEKKKLMDAIIGDPLSLSHLLNRQLPQELNEIAKQNEIQVFPNQWSDFEMQCSCPDWAVPCKHLAAVIYVFSAEIDRNPFLLFQLHDLDILGELAKAGMQLEGSVKALNFENLLHEKPISTEFPNSSDKAVFDLSKITPQAENVLSLLEDKALFYTKPFVPILKRHYKQGTSFAKNVLTKEIFELDPKAFEKIENIEIQIDKKEISFQGIKFFSGGEPIDTSPFNKDLTSLIHFLERIPKKYENRLSLDLKCLYRAYHLSIHLMLNGAYVPQILELEEVHYKVRWIPATASEEVNDLVESLEKNISQSFVTIDTGSKKKRYLAPKDQIICLLSIFLTHYVLKKGLFTAGTQTLLDFKIDELFFSNKKQSFPDFEEQQVPDSIHQYLQRLHISSQIYAPLIKIEDNPSKTILEIQLWVENKEDAVQKPVSLEAFVKGEKYAPYKASVFQSLSSLSKDFVDIKQLISSLGKEQLFLDGDGFATVLLQVLPIIKLLGIRILLPNSLKQLSKPQISMKLDSNGLTTDSKTYLNLNEMLDFQWQVAIGNQTVSIAEFKKLVKDTSGVVNIKGEYVLIDPKQIQTLLNNLEKGRELSHIDILQSALTEEYQKAKISLSNSAREIIESLLKSEAKPNPQNLKATLRPYQERGFQWLYNNSKVGFGSIIADDMGLGKTLQVITLLLQFKAEGRLDKKKGLIVVPTTLLTNWQKEIEKFAPDLSTYIYHGAKRTFDKEGFDIFMTTYGLLRSDVLKFQKIKWEILVIDEAQAIKNAGTEQTKAVKKIKATVKVAMSGTPVENRLSEYWSLFDFTNKGYLGSMKYFTEHFSSPIERKNDQVALHRFKKITDPFILRRLKTDKSIISDLPEKIEQDCFIALGKEQTALYQNVVDQMIKALNGVEEKSIERKGLVLKMITALKQVCNHPSQFLKKEDYRPQLSGKSERLLELLCSIYENNEKVLIFTQYKEMGQILSEILSKAFGTKPLFLHGGVSRKKRDEMVEDFQEKKHIKTFILSIKAGGTGLNLTAANHVIHYDLWWNPAVEAQATDRAFRIGQQKNVLVHRLISKGTFEEKINQMLQDKKQLANMAVSTGEKWIGDLSNDELKELVS
ncbi:SNF2-related protein [Aquimarina muelleri]|uniref:Helicase n=1 Tax=Aquimarina muelleri TaxID=279356 RepID=A0A918JSR9_9FLAO|nr:SNF2-related protein [Aquimarina muelleri]MCX2764799.1 SNF2-related protein [Aquimarina muelleri]GGX08556.1 helicase [Aquimarina muelleri]